MTKLVGNKSLLPSKGGVDNFLEYIDFLAALGCNTLMLELGGAFEYISHPEVNDGWLEYARILGHPGKLKEVHENSGCMKNSIHIDNGGGEVLSRSEMLKIIVRCRNLGVSIIPEVPSLSHSDYLLFRHQELAEHKTDPFPDTYCPSDPRSYELLFDILREVVEFFHPEYINIGHDEYFLFGLCEKCKGRKAEEIYSQDISKIHGFLSSLGVKTMMWGDKLLDSHNKLGQAIGGADRGYLPATYKAIDLIPGDINILHWYWGIDRKHDQDFLSRGFHMTFGNLNPALMPEWSSRSTQDKISGFIVSNWGRADWMTAQRNGVLFAVAALRRLLAEPKAADEDWQSFLETIFQELYTYRISMRFPDGNYIRVTHTTDFETKFAYLSDGKELERKQLGEQVVTYADGTTFRNPIVYGENISSLGVVWERRLSSDCDVYEMDQRLVEVAFTTCPVRLNGQTWYETAIPNPYPMKQIVNVEALADNPAASKIFIKQWTVHSMNKTRDM